MYMLRCDECGKAVAWCSFNEGRKTILSFCLRCYEPQLEELYTEKEGGGAVRRNKIHKQIILYLIIVLTLLSLFAYIVMIGFASTEIFFATSAVMLLQLTTIYTIRYGYNNTTKRKK